MPNARAWFYSQSFISSGMAGNAEPQDNFSVEVDRAKADTHAESRVEVATPQPASNPDWSTGDSTRVIKRDGWNIEALMLGIDEPSKGEDRQMTHNEQLACGCGVFQQRLGATTWNRIRFCAAHEPNAQCPHTVTRQEHGDTVCDECNAVC